MSRGINKRTATVSFVVPIRGRTGHLTALRNALTREQDYANQTINFEVIIVEADSHPTVFANQKVPAGWKYTFVETNAVFHKTRLLNIGLEMANSEFVVPYDVDLIPAPGVIARHFELAKQCHSFGVVTAYRLMSHMEQISSQDDVFDALRSATIAPEDQPSALAKYLCLPRKFGILPFFRSEVLSKIGGWDERFVGWGAEDEEVLSRYIATGFSLLRCPELVYIHQYHPSESHWTEADYVAKNRMYYEELLKEDLIHASGH